ncbi:MAG: hypothetical protein C4527_27850 [Candidatus Omnitrophota bacterium]|jgi:hypothetical protein|nr:MAG: hypothetical protein C4527_27850 [Candidatus Omnitrophota bacterium]
MDNKFHFEIQPQPNDVACGPTCLHAIYKYYNDAIRLSQIIEEVPQLEHGGTLAVLLACHALKRGYSATIYTYNMRVFDPTWFDSEQIDLTERLHKQLLYKESEKLRFTIESHLQFLELGGQYRFKDLTSRLLQKYLKRSVPILTGLSSTYLYRTPREYGPKSDYDDLRGEPSGHFVVICGYNKETRKVMVADPLYPNPMKEDHNYEVMFDRLISAILLGVLTYDANLLILTPPSRKRSISCPR